VDNLARIAVATSVSFEWLATGRGPERLTTTGETPAVEPSTFATNLFEERVLQLVRAVPGRKQPAILAVLEMLTK
jgi:hypothetical protein